METSLGKSLPPGDDWSESWEIADHGADQSRVEFGPLAGASLGELVARRGEELLGRHHPQEHFPLLLKYLDGRQSLSLQVHPNYAQAALLDPPDSGKTEAWYVVESEAGGMIYAGLKPGVDRGALLSAIRAGACEPCLNAFPAEPGQCVLLPAGAVHALGAGVLVAEIQQSSDTTYRLFDWNRLGPDGRPRPLRTEEGIAMIDFSLGPIAPSPPRATERTQVRRLVECDKFIWDRIEIDSPFSLGGDRRCHVLTVIEGAARLEGDPSEREMSRGRSALLPAAIGSVQCAPRGRTVLLDAYLP